MKFSDIDFSAISRIMDSMSDEEKDKLNDMAQNMMSDMQKPQESEEEEIDDFYAFLGIKEEDYQDLPGGVLDALEAACDLEQFYSEDPEADFSASILFYCKALLQMLRNYHYPNGFTNPATTTIQQYFLPLMQTETIHTLVDQNFYKNVLELVGTPQGWVSHKNLLQQASILLSRAEYDFIRYEDLQSFKNLLIKEKGLLQIKELI